MPWTLFICTCTFLEIINLGISGTEFLAVHVRCKNGNHKVSSIGGVYEVLVIIQYDSEGMHPFMKCFLLHHKTNSFRIWLLRLDISVNLT